MPLDRQGQLAGVTGRGGRLFYQDNRDWNEVQGVSSMAIAADTAQTQTQTGFEGSVSFAGAPEIGAVTFETASIMPLHRSWKYLAAQQRVGNPILLNFETRKREITATGASETVSIAKNATAGGSAAANLVGITQAQLGAAGVARGMILVADDADGADEVQDNLFVIERMVGDGLAGMVVSKADGSAIDQVTATAFSVIVPIFRWAIPGTITSVPKGDIGVESPITGSLVVQPRTSLADPVVALKHRGDT